MHLLQERFCYANGFTVGEACSSQGNQTFLMNREEN